MASERRNLECPVCLEDFTSGEKIPKGLRCHHNVCLPCARQLIQNEQIQCPTCRHVDQVSNANQLFTNHMVMTMVQEREAENKKQQQQTFKEDIEGAFERISHYKADLSKKVASAEQKCTKLKKSATKAKEAIINEFKSRMKILEDRKLELLKEVNATEKRARGQLIDKAHADFEQAAKLQREQMDLSDKDELSKEEYDDFKGKEEHLRKLSQKQNEQCEDIQVSFDQYPCLNDAIKNFGCVKMPSNQKVPSVPREFTQLEHLRSFGTLGSGRGEFNFPRGVAVTPTGSILVADYCNHRVQELDTGGHVLNIIGSEGTDNGCFSHPSYVAVDSCGNIYVTDHLNSRVQTFDKYGKYLYKFGAKGSRKGQFNSPRGIAIDELHDLLCVADGGNRRIQVFDLSGTFKRIIGNATDLKDPFGLCLHDDRLYVSNRMWNCIVVYRTDGLKIQVIGEEEGSLPGQFNYPIGIVADPYGRILVCEAINQRMQVLDGESGDVICVFGSKGSDKFNNPYGVTLTHTGQVVVAQAAGNRIDIFELK